jgi:hypothetical protein
MPSKREEIRANAKRADELAKQLAAEGKLMPSEGSKTAFLVPQKNLLRKKYKLKKYLFRKSNTSLLLRQ